MSASVQNHLIVENFENGLTYDDIAFTLSSVH